MVEVVERKFGIPSLVPVLSNVVKIKLEDGPEGVGNKSRVTISTEPVGVCNDSSGTQSGTIYEKCKKNAEIQRRINYLVEGDPKHQCKR